MRKNDQTRTAYATYAKPYRLRVGFVPLCDCAPLVMASEASLFDKYGLEVELVREVGWASIRDKMVHGQLEAAHALAAMPFAASLGVDSAQCPSATGVLLNLQGNAVSLSMSYWKQGVRDAKTFGNHQRKTREKELPVFGIVSPVSSHRLLMERWLAEAGLRQEEDYQLVVVPPPQVPDLIRAGHLAGFCVGEPWNSVAIQRGLAWSPATSADLAKNHPEKVLFVTENFASARHEEHIRLIAAVLEACALCARPERHEEISKVLSHRMYVNAPASLIRKSFSGHFRSGPGSSKDPRAFTIYHSDDSNAPTAERGHWVLENLLLRGVPDLSTNRDRLVERVFRNDLYLAAQRLRSRSSETHKTETKTDPETRYVNPA